VRIPLYERPLAMIQRATEGLMDRDGNVRMVLEVGNGVYETGDQSPYSRRRLLGVLGAIDRMGLLGRRVVMSTATLSRAKAKQPKRLTKGLRVEHQLGEWAICSKGSCPVVSNLFVTMAQELIGHIGNGGLIIEYYFSRVLETASSTYLESKWESLIGSWTIPFDRTARQMRCGAAMAKLHHYIE
jgi:hypothetical protein